MRPVSRAEKEKIMKVDIGNRIVAERLRDRAKGSLWGLIVGDCLGSPFQFGPRRGRGR